MTSCTPLSDKAREDIESALSRHCPQWSTHARSLEAPCAPTVSELNDLEELNAQLLPQGGFEKERPSWITHIAVNRDLWHGTAIFDGDQEDGPVYVLLYAKQQPATAMFLQCKRLCRTLPDFDMDPEIEDDPKPYGYMEFEFLSANVFLSEADLGISDFHNISVYEAIHFEGSILCSYSLPVDFAEFVQHHPRAAPPQPRQGGATTVKPHDEKLIEQLLRDYPFLTREDLERPLRAKVPRRKTAKGVVWVESGDSSGEDSHDEEGEAAVESVEADDGHLEVDEAAVDADLAEVRDEVHDVLELATDIYFHAYVRGGKWTMAHHGVAADAMRGECRSEMVRDWCIGYGFPQSMTFSIALYGREGAARMAAEFARRGNFFVSLWANSSDDDFVYEQWHIDACPEDESFLEFVTGLPDGDPVIMKSVEVRAVAPTV